jgi:uncharacterized protein YggT (Ycf19 family)
MPWLIRALDLLKILVVGDAVLSWGLAPDQLPRSLTKTVLDPVYAPLRRLLQPLTGSFDLSPLVALGLIFALQRALRPPPAKAQD